MSDFDPIKGAILHFLKHDGFTSKNRKRFLRDKGLAAFNSGTERWELTLAGENKAKALGVTQP